MNNKNNIFNIKNITMLLIFNFFCIYIGINSNGLNDADWWLFWAVDLKSYYFNDNLDTTCSVTKMDLKEIISCLSLNRYYPNSELIKSLSLEVPSWRNLADMVYCQPIVFNLLLSIIGFFYYFFQPSNPYNSILFTNLIYFNLLIFTLIYISTSTYKDFFVSNNNKFKILCWVFSPAILSNSIISLYSDIFYFLPILFSIYFFFKNKYVLSGAIFCIGLLYKPTVIYLLPFFLISGIKPFIKFNFSVFFSSIILHFLAFIFLNLDFYRYFAGLVFLSEIQVNGGINGHLSLIRIFWEPITRGWAYALLNLNILYDDYYYLKIYKYFHYIFFVLSFLIILIINKNIKNLEQKINLSILLIIFLMFSRSTAGNNHWLIIVPLLMYGSLKSNFFKYYFLTLLFFIGDLAVGLSRNTLSMQYYYFPYIKIEPRLLMFYASIFIFIYLIGLFFLFYRKKTNISLF